MEGNDGVSHPSHPCVRGLDSRSRRPAGDGRARVAPVQRTTSVPGATGGEPAPDQVGARTQYRLRPATPSDASALAALATSTFRDTYLADNEPAHVEEYIAAHFSENIQARELADASLVTLVGESADGRLVAYAQIRLGAVSPVPVPDTCSHEIARFYVDRSFHGRGIAHAMMDWCLTPRRENGGLVWLVVFQRNARAIRFYEKRGFRLAGVTTFLMGTDLQDDYVMTRSATTNP